MGEWTADMRLMSRRVPFDVFRDNESFSKLLDFAEEKRLGDFEGKCCYPVMKCGDDEDPLHQGSVEPSHSQVRNLV